MNSKPVAASDRWQRQARFAAPVYRLVSFAAGASADLAGAGFIPIRAVPAAPDNVMAAQTTRVRAALTAGTFRVRALDLFPPSVATAFRKGVRNDLIPNGPTLDSILYAIDQAWPGAVP